VRIGFVTVLWTVILAIGVALVAARAFLQPGPLRLSMTFSIPVLLIIGAVVNAIYNRITTGRMLESPPRRRPQSR
jgi:hypothetical protein